MKSTLIFLLLFCVSYTAFAKIDTVYTEQNGVVTMQILETPDESRVLEEKSFKNTTEYTLTAQEVNILMSGGTVQKLLTPRMETLFPPWFSGVVDVISLENGVTQQDRNTSEPEISWVYLVLCMMLPAIFILWLSVSVPGDKRRELVLFYFLIAAVAVAGAVAGVVVVDAVAVAVAVAGVVVVVDAVAVAVAVAGAGAAVAVAVAGAGGAGAAVAGAGAVVAGASAVVAAAGDISLAIQYTVFIAVSCLVGYSLRQLWLRRKDQA